MNRFVSCIVVYAACPVWTWMPETLLRYINVKWQWKVAPRYLTELMITTLMVTHTNTWYELAIKCCGIRNWKIAQPNVINSYLELQEILKRLKFFKSGDTIVLILKRLYISKAYWTIIAFVFAFCLYQNIYVLPHMQW